MNSRLLTKPYRGLTLGILFISLILNSAVFAAGGGGNDKQRAFRGLFVGTLDLAENGLTPIAFNFEKDGQATFIARQEEAERESPAIGQWKQLSNQEVKFGLVAYRFGHSLCSSLTPEQDENCTIIFVGQGHLDKFNTLTGEVTVKIRDRSSGDVGFELVLPFEVKKTSIKDLENL